MIFPSGRGARFSASLEIQGGVGPYTGVLVSASLDEQFLSGAEDSTPSEAEEGYFFT